MYEEKNKKESLFHAALIYSGQVRAGNRDNDKLKKRLEEYGSLENVYKYYNPILSVEDSLKSIKGIENIDNALKRVNFDFNVLTVNDAEYPDALRKSGASPVLYCRGNLDLMKRKSMGVVGTRYIFPNKDFDAYKQANDLLHRLMIADFTIVSGLALGCDTIAHTYAVERGGSTIGVLGTPLDRHYPAENKNLQDIITKEHLLVSQYPIGIRVFPNYFSDRNLTTASLSTDGIAVIKASDNSGTMHAVKYCAEQKKPIYVLENNFSKPHQWLQTYKDNIKRVK